MIHFITLFSSRNQREYEAEIKYWTDDFTFSSASRFRYQTTSNFQILYFLLNTPLLLDFNFLLQTESSE